ncbi:type II toxin-antitoxin system RelE/ParE family toxin [Asticcacaulis sp. SL142]|uniref:type II toxin-antitoxin system RelE/ParE family toxin n=1 Tax=Asticcacaulis sp. SL142 TaxID=2995155 RepID=UPI00226D3FE2|nr:type II toxin-antitoxin system RelE/ParE family toxin [Asticcacaulis sp. SL142]WAC48125.1 type II toxin-antitoxin system RelE/ParE family toxin [Asticcacaulis sp. SL142]
MRAIVWMTAARVRRNEAMEYIARDSPQAALSQLDEIQRQTRLLIDQPNIGRLGRIKGTRELVIRNTPFIVIYRVTDQAVQILRFLHTAQNR